MSKRILIIVTSNGQMGESGKTTGIWAEELAVPYLALIDAGFEVEIASPLGGPVPFDPSSVKSRGSNDPVLERFFADEVAQGKVAHTLAVAGARADDFDAVMFPGGHGTMWDLPDNEDVTRVVEEAHRSNKVIGAVCHGIAGLVSAKRPDGRSILHGKRVNSFTNEEIAAGLDDVVPFKLESRVRELGGHFEKTGNFQAFAVRDGKLITGQNPASSALVAKYVIESLLNNQISK
jgi:putative intracellular protease/amidase